MMPYQTLTESIHEGAFLLSEAAWYSSRDSIQVTNIAAMLSGTVLGMLGNPAAETATVAAAADNTGNGSLALAAPATTPQAVDGAYVVDFTGPTTFNVLDPRGRVLDKGSVGTAFAGPVAFIITAGATPFATGDRFIVTVLRPTGAGDSWAPLAADGSVEAAGVLFTQVYPSAVPGTVPATVMTRDCEVRASSLTWPAGFTPAQVAEGTQQLARRGIIVRPL